MKIYFNNAIQTLNIYFVVCSLFVGLFSLFIRAYQLHICSLLSYSLSYMNLKINHSICNFKTLIFNVLQYLSIYLSFFLCLNVGCII